jgi:1-acyl-sn-glycerol-3-phosphate acyltransferase
VRVIAVSGSDILVMTGAVPEIERTMRRGPLSYAQERLWALARRDPHSVAYTVPLALRLRGALDAGALSAALDALVARHEILRTRFADDGDGPLQIVDERTAPTLALVDLRGIARETLFEFTPFAWLIRSINAIPIDREGFGIAGIKESLRRLKRGEMVLIFPEGTRTPDGEIKQFRPGITSLAVRSRSAILPVAIAGAFQCWPKSQTFPRPGKIRVHYGRPILPQEYEGLNEEELVNLVENRVSQCLTEAARHL